jgi:archaellum biogenesis protein FlaJ (TadC family)
MFEKKHFDNKFWVIAIILIALVTITVVLQAQILMMLQDLQTSLFRSFVPTTSIEQVMDSNPLPIKPVDIVSDSNPNPPMTTIKTY